MDSDEKLGKGNEKNNIFLGDWIEYVNDCFSICY